MNANNTRTITSITRTALPNGKYRYDIDGEVHTKGATRRYEWASVYEHRVLSSWDRTCGREVGDLIVFLHARHDLAVKGNPNANRIAASGAWSRVGTIEIEEGAR